MPSIEPNEAQITELLTAADDPQAIVMINLLRYRERAAYPPSAAFEDCSGREAYGRYSEVALNEVAAVGGRILWMGTVAGTVIGPDGEAWDDAVLVEYPNVAAFLGMTSRPSYQAAVVHRTAALADSRLLRTVPVMSSTAPETSR